MNLINNEVLTSFNSNLQLVQKEDGKFATKTHKNIADKHVANSQDKRHVDKEKLNEHDQREATLMIDIVKLAANLKLKDSILFVKIVKGIKDVTEK